jgi:hypothetical protein
MILRVFAWLALLSAPLRADIYEWRDAQGNRHFTNDMVNVPEVHQARVKVIATGVPSPPGPEAPAAPIEAEEPRREPVVIYDHSVRPDSYEQGLRDGLALARSIAGAEEPSVRIQGPLAVANASPSIDIAPWYPAYYPFVTTSFDRGRSRHLTLRMLLQDQFQLDRDGPYAVERLGLPRGRLGLRPFLPRGLPQDRSLRQLRHSRVITR